MRRHMVVLLALLVTAWVSGFLLLTVSPTLAADEPANFSLTNGTLPSDLTGPGGTAIEEVFGSTTILVSGNRATASTDLSLSFEYEGKPCTGTAYLTFTGAFAAASGLLTGTYSYGYDIVYTTWMGNERQVGAYTGTVEAVIGQGTKATLPFTGPWTVTHYRPVPGGGWGDPSPGWGTSTYQVSFSLSGTVPWRTGATLAGLKGTGKVRISRDGGQTWIDATAGEQANVDDYISVEDVSGTRAKLTYQDGSVFVLKPGVVIRLLSGGLQVQQGEVWINLKKQGAAFEVVTPTSILGVMGTELQVTVLPDVEDHVVLFSGQVEVTGNGGGTVVLSPGQKVASTEAGLGQVESSAPFTDIADGPYRPAVLGMSQAGIVSGRQEGGVWVFGPQETVKRAQFAKMVCGAMEILVTESAWLDSAPPFPDLEPDKPDDLYPQDYVAAASSAGIIKGDSTGDFNPYDSIYRVGVVLMVVRALENLSPSALDPVPAGYVSSVQGLSGEHAEVMKKAEYSGLLAGLTGFGSTWNPWQTATRGEVAQILWNAMWR